MPPKNKYTDPKLRDQVKKEIQDSDKGGEPGQWSARKAQMMAKEYKKRGGDYTTDKETGQDEQQKSLEKWGDEEWQTKEGDGEAKTEDGKRKRYLPKKAWEGLSEGEKEETERKKLEGGEEGQQFVGNTGRAKRERKKVSEEGEKKKGGKGRKGGEGDDEKAEDGEEAAEEGEGEEEKPKAGQKRKAATTNGKANGQKKQKASQEDEEEQDDQDEDDKKKSSGKKDPKSKQGNAPPGKVGSKHMDATEPGPRGSSDRLPKKGDQVSWKAMPGYVDGEVVEVVTSNKKVQGKDVKGSKSDPKLVLKSSSSGKICVHKPDACFYE